MPSQKLLGSETPRVFTPPLRDLDELDATAGHQAISFAEEVLGIDLLPWQRWLLLHALELNDDETFRFTTVVVLVARQQGKSTLAQILSLFFMYARSANLVLGTAQNLDIAREVWRGAVDMAQDVPELAELIKRVVKLNGNEALELVSGERYKVQAANRRGGRGLSSDLVLLDELREHQDWQAWAAITKTTLARKYSQVWALSNAGDASSVVLRHLRREAHLQIGDPDNLRDVTDPEPDLDDDEMTAASSLGIFEWSAKPGIDKWDRGGWAQANPALGRTVSERAIAAAIRTDPDWISRTEVLCQWSEGSLVGPFPPGTWEAGIDADSVVDADSPRAWCVDVSHDRSMTYIAVAGYRPDGEPHVEVVAQRAGTAWVADWFADPQKPRRDWPVAVQARGAPVSSLLDDLRDVEGLTVLEWAGSALGAATGAFYDAVRCEATEGETPARVWHRPQPVLDVAAATAVIKPLGESYVWSRAKSPTDAAPLIAVTGALWALHQKDEAPPPSAYETDDLMVV